MVTWTKELAKAYNRIQRNCIEGATIPSIPTDERLTKCGYIPLETKQPTESGFYSISVSGVLGFSGLKFYFDGTIWDDELTRLIEVFSVNKIWWYPR